LTWLGPWILPITALVALAGGAVVIWLALRLQKTAEPDAARGRRRSAMDYECSECGQSLVIQPDELTRLSGVEQALVVGYRPKMVGRNLAEYVCPYCEASHCFAVDRNPPVWVGANLYAPQSKTSNCQECRKRLRPPHWPPGSAPDAPREAPDLQPDYGLVCSRCGAVCCVACVSRFSRVDLREQEGRCPRCGKGPVNAVFRP
jgi:hypothetical protein